MNRVAHTRAVIVCFRFRSEAVRDDRQNNDDQIHVIEDMTARQAMLAYRTRQLKWQKQVADCWTYAGRGLVKTNTGVVKEIVTDQDLLKVQRLVR